jgi:hypothetical protein
LPIALDQTSNLVGGVDKAVLALGATGDSIVGDAADDVLTGAAVGSGVGLGGGAVDADGGLGGLRAGLAGGAADAAGADVDGGRVAGVEVGLDGRVLGLGEAGDALGDQVGLALGVGVDDGLGLGGIGVGGDVAAVGLGGFGLRLLDVLLGHVESGVRHFGGGVGGVGWFCGGGELVTWSLEKFSKNSRSGQERTRRVVVLE